MSNPIPLQGIRIQLSGSFPENASDEERRSIHNFTQQFAQIVLRDGGTLVHGSDPDLIAPLQSAAESYLTSPNSQRDRLELVRAANFSTDQYRSDMDAQSKFANVQIIPAPPHDSANSVLLMRDWMAERCDLIVAIGGKWAEINWEQAGVRAELHHALARGRATFIVGGFGGAAKIFLDRRPEACGELHNGLSPDANRALAAGTDPAQLAQQIAEQIQRLPLIRNRVTDGKLFRILALNGGGLRGAFTAAVLARWAENMGPGNGQDLVKHFDLVAGTSTGAILALGLALGLSPAEILQFYRDKGSQIFPSRWRFPQWLWKPRRWPILHWLGSRYEAGVLAAALREVFQDKTLAADACCRLVIPTVRAEHGLAEVITTPHAPGREWFREFTAVQAALASAAAPTYFDTAKVPGAIATHEYLDGGIWANNPTLPAIAEAVRYLGIPLERIDVLSVGTLSSESNFRNALGKGFQGWAFKSTDLFFTAQESAAEKLGDRLLSESRHLRVNQMIPKAIGLDSTSAIEEMAARGDLVGEKTFVAVQRRFLSGPHVADWRHV